MKTSSIVYNYAGLDASGLAVKAQSIYDSLNGNSSYPSPAAFLPILQTNTSALTSAVTAGGNTPTPAQTGAIHAAVHEVKRVLKVIGALVNWDANGNEAVLLTSGFDLKTFTPASPKSFKAVLGKLSGEIDLLINSYGTVAYFWQMSTDPISSWKQVDLTTVSKTTIKGLTPGTKLWFRVSITKGNKVILVSDPYTIMVV